MGAASPHPEGRWLHRVVGAGASGRSLRSGDLARAKRGETEQHCHTVFLLVGAPQEYEEEVEEEELGKEQEQGQQELEREQHGQELELPTEGEAGLDAAEREMEASVVRARRDLLDEGRTIKAMVFNGHRVMVAH